MLIITGNDDFIGFLLLLSPRSKATTTTWWSSAIEQDKLALSIREDSAGACCCEAAFALRATNSRIFTVVGAMERNCYFFAYCCYTTTTSHRMTNDEVIRHVCMYIPSMSGHDALWCLDRVTILSSWGRVVGLSISLKHCSNTFLCVSKDQKSVQPIQD